MDAIEVRPGVRIPADEVRVSFVRSGGPGGQHANTSSTKVQLRFDVDGTAALSEAQKALVRERLGSRLTADGELVLESGEHRSQTRNREAVTARFANLLADALRPSKPRRRTRRSRAAHERRLEGKRQRAERKRLRRPPSSGDDR
jgi:ribosome-associated protein